MNNEIIQVNATPEGHKEGRRICTIKSKPDDMMTHFWATGFFYKINGRSNFGIDGMLDENGDWPWQDMTKTTQVWHMEGTKCMQ